MTTTKKTTTKKTTKPKEASRLLLYAVIDTNLNGELDNASYIEGIHFYRANGEIDAVEQYLDTDWDDYYGGGEADVEVFLVESTTHYSAVQESWSIKEVKSA